jgi:hypothetical protein
MGRRLLATDAFGPAIVFLNWGRWQATCPRACGNREAFGRCDDGTMGGLHDDGSFTCRKSHDGCGLITAAVWPPNVEDIERVVACRPKANRNWQPGETLADLFDENLAHGYVPDDTAGGGEPLQIVGDDVVRGRLGFAAHPMLGG